MRRAPSSASYVVAGLFLSATSFATLGGCGSRGPLDDTAVAAASDAGELDTGSPLALDAASPQRDAGREAGGPVSCGLCVLRTCGGTILSCIQSEGCRTVFQCVATTCLGAGGGLNPLCLFQCAGSDPAGALNVLGVLQCVTGQCGTDCGSALGGLGGLGGGLPGGKGGSGGGNGAGASFDEIFSPYPGLYSPVPPKP